MGSVVPLKALNVALREDDPVAQLVGNADMAARFDEFAEKLQRVAKVLERMSIEIKNRRQSHSR